MNISIVMDLGIVYANLYKCTSVSRFMSLNQSTLVVYDSDD